MTNQVKLHVGYIGKTREGKRVEATKERDGIFFCSDGLWRQADGTNFAAAGAHIIGPWKETINTTAVDEDGYEVPIVREVSYKPKPEYKTGVWYGWNGGDCPVYPETYVEVQLPRNTNTLATTADCLNWDEPLLFRIVTPYVEPDPKLECWALLDDDGDLLLCQTKEYAIASRKSWGGTIHRMIEADDQ